MYYFLSWSISFYLLFVIVDFPLPDKNNLSERSYFQQPFVPCFVSTSFILCNPGNPDLIRERFLGKYQQAYR
jgi:hypothetical protein